MQQKLYHFGDTKMFNFKFQYFFFQSLFTEEIISFNLNLVINSRFWIYPEKNKLFDSVEGEKQDELNTIYIANLFAIFAFTMFTL